MFDFSGLPGDSLGARLVLLVVGFLLTSILGGGLTALFQHLGAAAQRKQARAQQVWGERRQAFETVSRLMDRRLYAVRQFAFALDNRQRLGADFVEKRLEEYRTVLQEWNGSINSNLALLEIYYGPPCREEFDSVLGKEFVDTGALVEDAYRAGAPSGVGARIEALKHRVYHFNLRLLRILDDGGAALT